ncbi:MAG TPA: DUF1275 family protein [Polyangia bacterium]|jgi:uncharacterized membrane protein YoaK (UPF0700 family)|nr:DUF1275 family protein [Polyangia bacterium]
MAPSERRDGEDSRLVAALVLLTLLTGLVDAASVLGLGHVFTANMTGNIVFLGFSLVGAGRVATSDCVVALAAFVAGAVVAGRLTRLAGGASPRVVRRLTSVVVMLVGAVTGALSSRRGVAWTIGAAALVATSACVVASLSARSPSRES